MIDVLHVGKLEWTTINTNMLHELKLQPTFFDAIKAGIKTIECRLYDEKRQQIQLGDTLIFRRASELEETLETRVVGLLHYSTFSDLLNDFPSEMFGMADRAELERLLDSFYTREDEAKYGVVGIRIRSSFIEKNVV